MSEEIEGTATEGTTVEQAGDNVELPTLSEDSMTGGAAPGINLDSLMDVPVTLSVMIGKCKMPIKELLALNKGAVVELDKEVSEPLDLLVNGKLFAHGEVVVSGDKFGLRLVDIVSSSERLQKLK